MRTKGEAPATGKLPFDADRARRVSYTDYSMPPLEFLNEAPPPSEQADAELLGLATRLAEKCKEFNVTGQIKHICPGPVVTTYEFKPDAGVKYNRITAVLVNAVKEQQAQISQLQQQVLSLKGLVHKIQKQNGDIRPRSSRRRR